MKSIKLVLLELFINKAKAYLSQHFTIHMRASNVRSVTPVCPEEKTSLGIYRQRPWLQETFPDQDPTMISIQIGDFDGIAALVAPVEVSSNPIDGQTVRILQCCQLLDL